jgi:hypothetical protein
MRTMNAAVALDKKDPAEGLRGSPEANKLARRQPRRRSQPRARPRRSTEHRGQAMNIDEPTEIVVIGGGVTGASVSYWLARAGARVTCIERASPRREPPAPPSPSNMSSRKTPKVFFDLSVAAARAHVALEHDLGTAGRGTQRSRLSGVARASARWSENACAGCPAGATPPALLTAQPPSS